MKRICIYANMIVCLVILVSDSRLLGQSAGTPGTIAKFSTSKQLGNSVIIESPSGNIGVGTAAPTEKLSVAGNVTAAGSVTGGLLISTEASGISPLVVSSTTKVGNLNADLLDGLDSADFAPAAASPNYVAKVGDTMIGPLSLPANGLTVGANQLIATGGMLGIGTSSPTSPLTVNGTIESTSGGIKFPDGSLQTTAAAGTSVSEGSAAVSVSVFGTDTFADDTSAVTLTLSTPAKAMLFFTGVMGFNSTVQSYALESIFNMDGGATLISNFNFTPFPWTNQSSAVPAGAAAVTDVLPAGNHTFRMRIAVHGGPYGGRLLGRLNVVVLH
jgi:hypothetical protein